MAGLGPISMGSIKYFMKDGSDYKSANKLAVKEFLGYYLNYDSEELEKLQLMETKVSSKGEDIVYVVMASEEDIKEMYIRKA